MIDRIIFPAWFIDCIQKRHSQPVAIDFRLNTKTRLNDKVCAFPFRWRLTSDCKRYSQISMKAFTCWLLSSIHSIWNSLESHLNSEKCNESKGLNCEWNNARRLTLAIGEASLNCFACFYFIKSTGVKNSNGTWYEHVKGIFVAPYSHRIIVNYIESTSFMQISSQLWVGEKSLHANVLTCTWQPAINLSLSIKSGSTLLWELYWCIGWNFDSCRQICIMLSKIWAKKWTLIETYAATKCHAAWGSFKDCPKFVD